MQYKVVFFQTNKGESPVEDFLKSLDSQQRAKIVRKLLLIQEYGLQAVIPHIKKLIGYPIWELRIIGRHNIRIFYVAYRNNQVLLLHGFIKKKQKTPHTDINTALNRKNNWETRHKDNNLQNDII